MLWVLTFPYEQRTFTAFGGLTDHTLVRMPQGNAIPIPALDWIPAKRRTRKITQSQIADWDRLSDLSSDDSTFGNPPGIRIS
jgi:hypothetical protein